MATTIADVMVATLQWSGRGPWNVRRYPDPVSLTEYPLAETLTLEDGRAVEWEAVGDGPPPIKGYSPPAWAPTSQAGLP